MHNKIMATFWNGKTAPRIGIGTWVMGGAQYWGDQATGWAGVDDRQSLAALDHAFAHGVRIIDTAISYGGGHAETIIAQALKATSIDRSRFIIATKVGIICDPASGNIEGVTDDPQLITEQIEGSLKRLQLDHIDLVKFHLNHHDIDKSHGVFDALSQAYDAGKIGGFGWSNDDVDGAIAFSNLPGYVAVQHDLNLFKPADAMLRATEAHNLWSFCRQPLAMGLLTGKFHAKSAPLGSNDIRGSGAEWLEYFDDSGRPSAKLITKLEAIRACLTADGRTLAQGALGWILAQSDRTIPLPGCRTPAQADDNFGVIEHGPLSGAQLSTIRHLLCAE